MGRARYRVWFAGDGPLLHEGDAAERSDLGGGRSSILVQTNAHRPDAGRVGQLSESIRYRPQRWEKRRVLSSTSSAGEVSLPAEWKHHI